MAAFAQPVGQHRACGSGAHDDVVILEIPVLPGAQEQRRVVVLEERDDIVVEGEDGEKWHAYG